MSASIYLAASTADDPVADVLQVYLEHAGIACVRRADVQVLMDYAEDLRMTMKDCTAIIVLDSFSFRVRISLHSQVQEKFRLDLNDQQAEEYFIQLIQQCTTAVWPRIHDILHDVAAKFKA